MEELIDLLESQGPALCHVMYRVTLRQDVVEDLLQELFLKLRASQGFGSAKNRVAYARAVALHLAFDWRRRKLRSDESPMSPQDVPSQDPSPLDQMIEQERVEQVLDAMTWLAGPEMEVLSLRYLQDESYEAIADDLGKTPHQVRALCHKALERLRDFLALKHDLKSEEAQI